MKPHWQLIAYDIRDPKRLRRIHRALAKTATPVQYSVFLFHGHAQALNALLQQLGKLMNLNEDDLRAYPISHPDALWQSGQPLAPELTRPAATQKRGWRDPFTTVRAWFHER